MVVFEFVEIPPIGGFFIIRVGIQECYSLIFGFRAMRHVAVPFCDGAATIR